MASNEVNEDEYIPDPQIVYNYSKDLVNLIKDQGETVCRDIFERQYLLYCLQKFDIGFIYSQQVAAIGQSFRSKKGKMILKGFILCQIDERTGILNILLVCGRKGYGQGDLLIPYVIDYSKQIKIRVVELYALPDPKLIVFYKKYGFSSDGVIFNEDGTVKVYRMTLSL